MSTIASLLGRIQGMMQGSAVRDFLIKFVRALEVFLLLRYFFHTLKKYCCLDVSVGLFSLDSDILQDSELRLK